MRNVQNGNYYLILLALRMSNRETERRTGVDGDKGAGKWELMLTRSNIQLRVFVLFSIPKN